MLRSEFIILIFVYQKRIWQFLYICLLKILTRAIKEMNKDAEMTLKRIEGLPLRLIVRIIDYLGTEQLQNFALAIQQSSNYDNISKIVRTRLVYSKYFNVFDRSYYLDIFSNTRYFAMENSSYYQLGLSQNYNKLNQFPNQFQFLLNQTTLLVPTNIRQQFTEKMRNLFVDPPIAMPRLHRQTVGLSVNSNFQSFLVSILESEMGECDIYDETFQLLREKFEESEQDTLRLMMQSNKVTKLRQIRYQSHLISYESLSDYLYEKSDLTNFIAHILGLTDLFLNQIATHLQSIEDPLELFIQLTSRYMQFHNFVLAVQENLGYIFAIFDELYTQLYGSNGTKYTFYNSAFLKWKNKMDGFHSTTHKVYSALLVDQINQKTLKKDSPIFFSQCEEYKQEIYEYLTNSSLDKDTLISLYTEYNVDMSVNQNNVFWCGHSQQQFGEMHKNLQTEILKEQANFVTAIYQAYNHKTISLQQIQQLLSERVLCFEQYVKRKTLKSLQDFYNRVLTKNTEYINFVEMDKIIQRANQQPRIQNLNSYNKLNNGNEMEAETVDSNTSSNSSDLSSIRGLNQYDSENEDLMEEEYSESYISC